MNTGQQPLMTIFLMDTVNPIMFAVPLFHELNKTAQLNGVILIGLIRVLELCGLNSPE